MGKLTVRAIDGAKATGARYFLADGGGLFLRVGPDGAKSWVVRYSLNGKQREKPLTRRYGPRSDTAHISLEDARHEAAAVRAKARDGVDHWAEQEQARKAQIAAQERERAASLSVSDLFEAWMRDGIFHKDGGVELRRRMEKDVIPAIGTLQVRAIHERDILTIVRAIAARGAPNMAIKVLNALKQMFGWGEDRLPWRRLIEVNPAGSIGQDTIVGRDYEEGADTRSLAEREIPELRDKIKALRNQYESAPDKRVAPQPLEKRTELAIWIMLSTCCRVGEIGRARRADVDLDARVWFIPKEHSKNQDAHVIFLSDFAARQFRSLLDLPTDSGWLFPSAKESRLHADVKNITKQIGDRQLSKSHRNPGNKRVKAAGADALLLSGGGWTPHDLRRTGSTMMEALGVLPAVIDKCLNHREPNKLRRTYMRYDYAGEKREAWRLLGDRLDLLMRGDADNVVVLRPSA